MRLFPHAMNFICCLEKNNWFHNWFQVQKAANKLTPVSEEERKRHQNNKSLKKKKERNIFPLVYWPMHTPPHFC